MNTIHIIGRLTKEPELYIKDEKKYVKFTLATQQSSEHTNFLPCIAFDKTAELIANHVNKGERIYAVGYVRSVQNENGSFLMININRIEFADKKADNTNEFITEEKPSNNDLPWDN
jgi:single-strand DNA-binding protein